MKFLFNKEIQDFAVTTTIDNQNYRQQRHVTGIITTENRVIDKIDNIILTNGNYVMPLIDKLNVYIPVYPVKVRLRGFS